MQICLCHLPVGLCRPKRHFRFIAFFFADSTFLKKPIDSHMLAPRALKLGLGLRKSTAGPFKNYLTGNGVYLKELGSLLHELALLKGAFFQDAAHAGADLHFKKARGLADEFGLPVSIRGFNIHNFHKRRGRRFF